MDKIEEMIEELARILRSGGKCSCSCSVCKNKCLPYCHAMSAIGHNYRKISEDMVVLTREEYDRLRIDKGNMEFLKKQLSDLPIENAILKKRDKEQADLFSKTVEAHQNAVEEAKEQARKQTTVDVYELIGARLNEEKGKTYQEIIGSPYVAENETEKETMARHDGYLYGLGVSQALVKKYHNENGVGVE